MTPSPPPSFAQAIDLIPAEPDGTVWQQAANRAGYVFFCAHIGSSMNPTLCDLDLLEIEAYGDGRVECGDVILFRLPEDRNLVVHRVTAVTPAGMRTRGDSNTDDDAWLVRPEEIIGRVVAAWRGERRRSIVGGRSGLLRARLAHYRRAIDRSISRRLHPLYRALARSNIIHHLLPSCFAPRVVLFTRNGEKQIKLMLGLRVIGRYDNRRRQWLIQRPFRLLADEKTLRLSRPLIEHLRDW